MEYTTLTGTSLTCSRIGFGAWAIGRHGYGFTSDDDAVSAVRRAVDSGITLFDTADVYGFGHSETLLAKALGASKGAVVLATKGGVAWDASGRTRIDSHPAHLLRAVDDSLQRLHVDCIPLYQLHRHDGVTPLDDVVGALQLCQDRGKVRYFGCSNADVTFVSAFAGRLRELRAGPCASLQNEFSLLNDASEGSMKAAAAHGVSVIAFSVLGRGALSGKYRPGSTFGENDTRDRDPLFTTSALAHAVHVAKVAETIGAPYGRNAAQVAIRWVLDHPQVSVALVGAKTAGQVDTHVGAADWQLAREDWLTLKREASARGTHV